MIILNYGLPYSGKSYFTSQFPKPYVISLDGNAKYLYPEGSYKVVRSINDYSRAISDFLKDPKDFETLIIDPIDLLEQYIRGYYLDKLNIEDEAEGDFGKPWRLIREGFYQSILKTTKFAGDVILISWEQNITSKNRLGVETTRVAPGFNPKLQDRISGLTTMIAHSVKVVSKRGTKETTSYKVSFGHFADELSGTRIPIKSTIINNSYDEFKHNLGHKKEGDSVASSKDVSKSSK